MALPLAFQQTLQDVEAHYRRLHEEVMSLQRENQEMKQQLREMDPSNSVKVIEAIDADEPMILQAPKVAFEETLATQSAPARTAAQPDHSVPLPGSLEEDLLEELPMPHERSAPNRIRKVSTQMVHDAVHIRKQMMNGQGDDSTLASDKMRKLKMDPFEHMLYEQHSFKPMLTRQSFCSLCFPHDRQANCVKRFTNGLFFKSITMLAIAANTLYLGLVADNNVKNAYKQLRGEIVEKPSVIPDISFTAWFTIEIFIKMLAEKVQFFVGEEKYWNWFDLALVTESIIGVFLEGGPSLSFLRIFRVFRLVRVVKVVRSVKALARLRTMIFAILHSFVDLLWAFLVIVLIVFVFAIVFDNAVADYFLKINPIDILDPESKKAQEVFNMELLFGDLLETMISLWSAVSGGNDWMFYGDLLREVPMGGMYFAIFNFYVAFCVVGMFNVVTGVFVDSAVCVRTGDEVVQGYLDDLRQTTEEIKGFFKEADIDGSGTLNWSEFQHHMQNPAVKAYFSGLDIDPEEAEIIFTILDGDKSKEIKIDEFVNGTMKLKGSATKLDLMALMYDQTRQNMKFDALCDFVEEELQDIKRRMQAAPSPRNASREPPGAPAAPRLPQQVPAYRSPQRPRQVREVRIDANVPRVIDSSIPRVMAVPRRR